VALPDVRIRGKCGFGRGVVEDHGLLRAKDSLDDRLGQRRCAQGLVAQPYDNCIASRYGFRRDPLLNPV
jgi:hypothetical protein